MNGAIDLWSSAAGPDYDKTVIRWRPSLLRVVTLGITVRLSGRFGFPLSRVSRRLGSLLSPMSRRVGLRLFRKQRTSAAVGRPKCGCGPPTRCWLR